jgi:hypothetical protein
VIETATTSWICPVCEEQSAQTYILSQRGLPPGPPDLDARKFEDKVHGLIAYEIWRCPWCGFTDSPPSDPGSPEPVTEGVAALVRSHEYRYQLRVEMLPALANSYLCRALIEVAEGRLRRAGWLALKAAWVCDDLGDRPGARYCRSRTVDLWEAAEEAGEPIVEDGTPARQLLLADVLRRARRFDEAKAHCDRGRSAGPKEPLRTLLAFEDELASREDSDAHAVVERLDAW